MERRHFGGHVEKSKWFRWLATVTDEHSERGIARKIGVSHTTVQRWVRDGVPVSTVWELTLRFQGDPLAAMVLLRRIDESQLSELNWAAIVRYAPIEVLGAELAARITAGARLYPKEAASLQKRSTGVWPGVL